MEISNIIIEKRPRLQCANFFITFTENFVQQDAVKLNVSADKLVIRFDDREFLVKLSDHLQLHTKTLSQLIIKKNYVSFRINTNMENFTSEVLEVHPTTNANNNSYLLESGLTLNTPYKVHCSNCTNILTPDEVIFGRILELPSENMDMSEWFCHKHGTCGASEAVSDTNNDESRFYDESIEDKFNSNKFKPGTKDIFYGNYFGLFNMKLFKNVRIKGKLVYCRRCFQFLGELTNLKYKDAIKVWNDTVNFEKIPSGDTIFLFDNTSLLKNFIFILCKLQHDFTFELFGLPQLFKVIFEATLSDGKKNFLLLQVMDHNLEMLRLQKPAENDEIQASLLLEKCKTMKLLFKFEEDEEQPLVKFWLSNTNVSSVQISPQMFTAAVEYLTKMSSLIPECYRTSYGFVLSYLDM
ncbi:uncharacterized protein LOC134829293 [Culicoides brevitarsis]|uniref:uncharacterized protein LOC134829293 n=1 Tax=Culicoides brevitarsis TaxID=469753 RepID=UPI00307B11E6